MGTVALPISGCPRSRILGQAPAEASTKAGASPHQTLLCRELWEVLAEALREHGMAHPITKTVESPHGTRYCVDGKIESPDRRNPCVRSVWMLETGTTTPRLITAFPLEVPE